MNAKGRGAWGIVLFVGFFSLYLLTISNNLSASHDSIAYINGIDAHQYLFHPHHLLYAPVSILWLDLLRAIGFTSDSNVLVASLNSLFGALSLVVIFYSLRTYSTNNWKAFSTTAIIGLSFGFWFYSDCVEVYIIPLFLLLCTLPYLLSDAISKRDLLIVGLLHGLATLFHQTYCIVGISVLAKILIEQPHKKVTAAIGHFAIYFFTALVVVAAGYIPAIIFSVHATSVNEALYWMTLYAHTMGAADSPGISSLFRSGVGFFHSIIGGHFLFAIPVVKNILLNVFAGHVLSDEIYLVKDLTIELALILILSFAVLLGIIITAIIGSIKYWRNIYHSQKKQVIPIVVWLATFSLFFAIWDPTNLEFWIPQSVLCWIILDRLLFEKEKRQKIAFSKVRIAIPLLLFAINFAGSIYWLRTRSHDYFYAQTASLSQLTTSSDLIITDEQWITEDYYKRFLPTTVYSPQDILEGTVSKQAASQKALQALSTHHKIVSSIPLDSASLFPQYSSLPSIWNTIETNFKIKKSNIMVGDKSFWVFTEN